MISSSKQNKSSQSGLETGESTNRVDVQRTSGQKISTNGGYHGFMPGNRCLLVLLIVAVASLCQPASAAAIGDIKEKILSGSETLGGGGVPNADGSFGSDTTGNVIGAIGRTLHNTQPSFPVPGRGPAGALINNPLAKKVIGDNAAEGTPGANFGAGHWGVDVPQDKCKWTETEADKAHGKCFLGPKGCQCPKNAPIMCNTREVGPIVGLRDTETVCCEKDDNKWCKSHPGIGQW